MYSDDILQILLAQTEILDAISVNVASLAGATTSSSKSSKDKSSAINAKASVLSKDAIGKLHDMSMKPADKASALALMTSMIESFKHSSMQDANMNITGMSLAIAQVGHASEEANRHMSIFASNFQRVSAQLDEQSNTKRRKGASRFVQNLKDIGTAILKLSIAVAILALASILIGKTLGGFIALVLAVAALAMVFILADKFMGRGPNGTIAGQLMMMAAGIAVLALAVMVWDKLTDGGKGLFSAIVGISALALVMVLVSRTVGKDVMKFAISMIIASVAIIVLAFAIKQFADISWENLAIVGAAVGGLALVLGLLGAVGPAALIGGAALMVGALAILVLAAGIKVMVSAATDEPERIKDTLIATAEGLAYFGLWSPLILLGAAGMLVSGVALMLMAPALMLFKYVKPEYVDVAAMAISQIADAFSNIGILTAAQIAIGSLAMLPAALTVVALGASLASFKRKGLTTDDVQNIADILDIFIVSIADTFDRNSDKMWDVFKGSIAMSGIGNMITSLATGVANMSNLQFVEMAVKNGKLVPVSTRNLNKGDFRRAAHNVEVILHTLTDPLARVGQKGSPYDIFGWTNPVAQGVRIAAKIGTAIKDIAVGVADMARLNYVEYDVKNGKLVPVSTRKLNSNDFKMAAYNTGMIINAMSAPLAKVGKGAGLIYDSDVGAGIKQVKDLGNVLTTTAKGVADMSQLKFNEYAIKKGKLVIVKTRQFKEQDFINVGINFKRILRSITKPLADIGAGAGIMSDSDVKNGLDELEGLEQVFKPITKLVAVFSDNKLLGQGKKVGKTLHDMLSSTFRALSSTDYKIDKNSGTLINTVTSQVKGLIEINGDFGAVVKNLERSATSVQKMTKALEGKKLTDLITAIDKIQSLKDKSLHESVIKLMDEITKRLVKAVDAINSSIKESTAIIATAEEKRAKVVQQKIKDKAAIADGKTPKSIITNSTDNADVLDDILTELENLNKFMRTGTIQTS